MAMRSARGVRISVHRTPALTKHFLSVVVLIIVALLSYPIGASDTPLVRSRSKAALSQQKAQPQNVLQIIETEVYENKVWIGAKARWSSLNGSESEPPPTITPPKGCKFEGDWKIVTSSNRDSLGWEYLWFKDQPAMRRRLWLRTVVAIPKQPSQSLVSLLQEHWNFKGFGMSLYKSMLSAQTVGIALRLPILYNLDWWERHPGLPSLSTAITCYFPPMIVYGFSGSLNVDLIAWVLGRSCRYAMLGLCVVMLAVCRLMFLPVAILLYPSRKKLILPDFPLPTIPRTPAIYSLTISQRVGMTVSWRISQERGYEFRVNYWYECLPTILHLCELFYRNKQLSNTKLTNWLRRKSASTGLSYGGPTPSAPHFFVTACMSLSGFQFRKPKSAFRNEPVEVQRTNSINDKNNEEIEKEVEGDSPPRKQKVAT